jgi:hypothetical protein
MVGTALAAHVPAGGCTEYSSELKCELVSSQVAISASFRELLWTNNTRVTGELAFTFLEQAM